MEKKYLTGKKQAKSKTFKKGANNGLKIGMNDFNNPIRQLYKFNAFGRPFFNQAPEKLNFPQGAGSGGQRSGMVLVFVIVILVLIGMMGVFIMVATRSEVNVSTHFRQSQDAFHSSDSFLKLAILLSRTALRPVLGTPQDLLGSTPDSQPAHPLTVEINHHRLNLESLIEEADPFGYSQRYLETTELTGDPTKRPHLIFKVNGEVVGVASVTLDTELDTNGYSLNGADRYDSAGGGNSPVDLVIVVTGTRPTLAANVKDEELFAPRTIIMAITRDLS
ncbi:MAG: hypothetical protein LBT86_04085 [Deltaproteobacteria bacterium]|jgi:hypothetical protein|nr:hypothetical protein [Deltaproteobacteria bacterium]